MDPIIADIKRTDESLYYDLQSWTKDLIERIKTGMDSMEDTKDNRHGTDMMKKEIKKLADMFKIEFD